MSVPRIRLFAMDVDGVLTDNGIWIGEIDGRRVEFKRFDIQDGLGLILLRWTDLQVAWVSARPSAATALRATELGIGEVLQVGDARKVPAMTALLTRLGIAWHEVAYLGDDLADVPVLQRVGFPMAVSNAVAEAKALATFVTTAAGGFGAVREAVIHLLRQRGDYEAVIARYLEDRSAPVSM